MRVLFFLSHPAQFHFSKLAIVELRNKNMIVDILVKTKDVLIPLLNEWGLDYTNIQVNERSHSRLSILFGLIKRDIKIFKYCHKKNYDLLIGTDASLAHVGVLLKIPVITTLEDDYKVIKNLAWFTFPFTSYILTPNVCNVGRWKKKKIGYNGYMKLAYLHPNRFKIKSSEIHENMTPFSLIRLSGLKAHHDFKVKGITELILGYLINCLRLKGKVYISSEKDLPPKYSKYILDIPVTHLHNILANATILVCDSQSMAVEAAMLATPSIRISGFSGKISVLEELEYKYQLTFGYRAENWKQALMKISQLLMYTELKNEFRIRRDKMLKDKIDVTGFLVWIIEHFPESIKYCSENPHFQNQFISDNIHEDLLAAYPGNN